MTDLCSVIVTHFCGTINNITFISNFMLFYLECLSEFCYSPNKFLHQNNMYCINLSVEFNFIFIFVFIHIKPISSN